MNIPVTVLAVIDGFGYQEDPRGNAIAAARTPTLDYLWSNYTHFLVKAAEEEVGLAWGEVGNSEVGHMAIGCGRVITQSLARINLSLDDGTFDTNPAFLEAIDHVNSHDSALHLMGIISTPGVHGHLNLMLALIRLAAAKHVKHLYLHLLLDGRDSGPRDTPLYMKDINTTLTDTKVGRVATIGGRAFGMDRNNNWEKIEVHYKALMGQSKFYFPSVQAGLDYFYGQNIDDEFIPPSLIIPEGDQAIKLQPNDAIIFTNYREDRARQLTKALSLPSPPVNQSSTGAPIPTAMASLPHDSIATNLSSDHQTPVQSTSPSSDNGTMKQLDNAFFNEFPREHHPSNLLMVTMTEYEKGLPVTVAFPPPEVPNTLSDILAGHQIPQLHVAESEKYAHVTYFFNGGRETKRPLEEYMMIPSVKPEEFETHPEMSAAGITDAVVNAINSGWPFIILNFANSDMVGHTGNFKAAIIGLETIDACFKRIWDAVSAKDGYLYITADHGNSENMINLTTQKVVKEHTANPVPFIIASSNLYHPSEKPLKVLTGVDNVNGLLSDVAPTILTTLGLPIPEDMTGTNLL